MRFFLIDRITAWQVGTSAEAIKNVALSEDFFDDHFPRRPVMPGVLMIEGMAQLAGLLLEASLKQKHDRNAKAILTILERTKFRGMVRPGDTLRYRTEVLSVNPSGGKASAQALCDGKVVVTTAMVFAFKYIDDPLLDERRSALMKTWLAELGRGKDASL
jgi:3-hydroxyacyl-[acyl-carrier-protein] dehydratase